MSASTNREMCLNSLTFHDIALDLQLPRHEQPDIKDVSIISSECALLLQLTIVPLLSQRPVCRSSRPKVTR
jgi:hypothetical protein